MIFNFCTRDNLLCTHKVFPCLDVLEECFVRAGQPPPLKLALGIEAVVATKDLGLGPRRSNLQVVQEELDRLEQPWRRCETTPHDTYSDGLVVHLCPVSIITY